VVRAEEETGADVGQVARAFAVVREVFGVRRLWRDIEALDYRVPAEAQYEAIFQISRMVRRAVYWFLQSYAEELEVEPLVLRFKPGAEELMASLPKYASRPVEQRVEDLRQGYETAGLPAGIARRIAALATITQTLDIVELAREFELDVTETGELHFALREALR